MPKIQLRMPKSANRPQPVQAPQRNGKVAPTVGKKATSVQEVVQDAPVAVATKTAPKTVKMQAPRPQEVAPEPVQARVKKTVVVEAKATPPPVQTPKHAQTNGTTQVVEKPSRTAKPTVAEAPTAAPKPKRETRLRGRVEVRKFLPRAQRVATLRTSRAIGFLEQIEARAVEARRPPKGQEFPMSVMEMKALNEAIKIMQIKYKLEQEDIERQKQAKATGTAPATKK